jgi:hypothetical protein
MNSFCTVFDKRCLLLALFSVELSLVLFCGLPWSFAPRFCQITGFRQFTHHLIILFERCCMTIESRAWSALVDQTLAALRCASCVSPSVGSSIIAVLSAQLATSQGDPTALQSLAVALFACLGPGPTLNIQQVQEQSLLAC